LLEEFAGDFLEADGLGVELDGLNELEEQVAQAFAQAYKPLRNGDNTFKAFF
jgi:hypothetical protein